MLENNFNTFIILLESLLYLSISWHIFIKGSKTIDNIWIFLSVFSFQFFVLYSTIAFFPFSSFFFFLLTTFFSDMILFFLYSFPHSIKIPKRWYVPLFFVDFILLTIFKLSIIPISYVYFLKLLFFMIYGVFFIIKKQNYLSRNKKSITKFLTLSFVAIIFIFIFIMATLTTKNVEFFKHYSIYIFPLFFFFFLLFFIKNIENTIKLSFTTIFIFLLLAIPETFLLLQLSSLRIFLLNIISINNFFITATVVAFVFFNLIAFSNIFLASFIQTINSKKNKLLAFVMSFRKRTEKITTTEELFLQMDKTIKKIVKNSQTTFFFLNETDEFEKLKQTTTINFFRKSLYTIKKWIEKNKLSYILENSMENPPEIQKSMEDLQAKIIFPIKSGGKIIGFLKIDGKKIKKITAEIISELLVIASDKLVKIALFEKVLETEKQLQEAKYFQETDKMVSLIAHEIRTPLTSVVFNLDVIADSYQTEGVIDEEFLDIARDELKRLNETVDKMLVYGRNIILEPQKSDFETFITNIKKSLSHETVEIIFDNKTKNKQFSLDWDKLRHIFLNIITNATKEISKIDLKTGKILVTINETENNIKIEIANNGPEIPKEIKDEIFEPFFTTKKEGNGLGLAICDKIVKIWGGKIKIKSSKEFPVIFSITLPKT